MAEIKASAKKAPKSKAAKPAEPVEVKALENEASEANKPDAAVQAEKAVKTVKTAKSVKSAGKAKAEKKTEAPAAPAQSIDDITIALWNILAKADVSQVQPPVAVQVVITGVGTFFIAVKQGEDGNEKHIIQDIYNDRNGTFETTYAVMLEIIKGSFDFTSALTSGTIHYQGDLAKALTLKGIFGF
jgi:hypothetical protein